MMPKKNVPMTEMEMELKKFQRWYEKQGRAWLKEGKTAAFLEQMAIYHGRLASTLPARGEK